MPYNNRGNACRRLGKTEKAIADLDQAIRLKPDYADAYENRGLVYYDLKQWDRSIKDYDQMPQAQARAPTPTTIAA